MKILKHPIYLSLIFIALTVYILKLSDIALPNLIGFYLNDLLCMPIVLATSLATIRCLKKNNTLYAPLTAVVTLTIYFILYFEWFLPKHNIRYTADVIDAVLYAFGAILFYAFQKRLF